MTAAGPRPHAFRYRLFMADRSRGAAAPVRSLLAVVGAAPGLAWFRRADYLGDPACRSTKRCAIWSNRNRRAAARSDPPAHAPALLRA